MPKLMFEIPDHVRGLIFDCDGTIADTMPLHYQSWVTALNVHDVEFPEDYFYELAGVTTSAVVEVLNRKHGRSMPVSQTATHKDSVFAESIPAVLPIDPVVEVVRHYHGKLPMAVASGGGRGVVVKTLEALDLLQYFQAVVTGEEVTHGKPAPDIFLEAARRIGVPAEHCAAFEDADMGMTAIRAAEMVAIDVRPVYGRTRR